MGCAHPAVFKAFFNRTKDWTDLVAMRDAVARAQQDVGHLGEDVGGALQTEPVDVRLASLEADALVEAIRGLAIGAGREVDGGTAQIAARARAWPG